MSPEDDVLQQLIHNIQQRLETGESLDEAVDTVRRNLARLGVPQVTLDRLNEAREWLRDSFENIEELSPPILVGRRDRPDWYAGPQEGDVFWPGLRRSFADRLRLSERDIDNIDNESNQVVKLLDYPGSESFSTRGLVVGRVQSGKTANMTAVMAKAADRGIRFFVVLAGMTNALRNQTEERFERDLVQIDRERWTRWTDVDCEFQLPTNRAFRYVRGFQIAVIKKNMTVLDNFVATLANTSEAILRETPFMIIDDECDQASVNTANSEYDMSAINERIRRILQLLPRVAFVGYTATPFANVLIDPAVNVDSEHPDDLYPKDFIFSLRQPESYFGPELLFGRDLLDADEVAPDEQGLDMINIVPESESPSLRPPRARREEFIPEMTPTLEDAVRYYLMATAARAYRGQSDQHSCMLIHTTIYTAPHFRLRELIDGYVQGLMAKYRAGDSVLIEELKALWSRELVRVPSGRFKLDPVGFEEMQTHLEDVLSAVEVTVENNESDTRLDFRSVVRRYIVVGGSVLSRGLTIEGLLVSYFLRTSSQYDSLMQMGRWFGYRPGYQDLPRVWMTSDLSQAFRDMATIEAEIRYDIEEYAKRRVTPLEFAVRIRQIPGMAITARNKMLAATRCNLSFSGEHVQTRRFYHQDRDWLENNWLAGETLVDTILDTGLEIETGRGGMVFRDVPVGVVKEFIRSYQIHETHRDMAIDHLLGYIDRQNRRDDEPLFSWNVAVIQPNRGRGGESVRPLGRLGNLQTIERAKISPEDDEVADIKALMSRQDLLIDIPGGEVPAINTWQGIKEYRERQITPRTPPLLLLYPIYRNSQPRSQGSRRPLGAVHDVLGIGLVFPNASQDEPQSYVRVQLPAFDYEEAEGLEEVE